MVTQVGKFLGKKKKKSTGQQKRLDDWTKKSKNTSLKRKPKVDINLSKSTRISACNICPADYKIHTIGSKKKCLKYGKQGLLSSAVALCAKDGGRPPLPTNAKENADLLKFFNANRNQTQDNFALDLSDVKTEGKFVNSKGEKVNFTNWLRSEPDNKNGNQHFVSMWHDGEWNDYEGNFSTSIIICQKDCQSGKCDDINTTISNFTLVLTNGSASTNITSQGNLVETIVQVA